MPATTHRGKDTVKSALQFEKDGEQEEADHLEVKSGADRADAASDGAGNEIGHTPENGRRQSERGTHRGRAILFFLNAGRGELGVWQTTQPRRAGLCHKTGGIATGRTLG